MLRKDFMNAVKKRSTEVKVALSVLAMSYPATLSAFAADPSGGGTNVLNDSIMSVISQGFEDLKVTAVGLVIAAIPTTIAVIGIKKGCDFGIKRVKDVLDKAS